MKPSRELPIFGWHPPARALLIGTIAALASALAWSTRSTPTGEAPLPTLSVDANSAPLPVLNALPGLGPVLSGRIIAARPLASLDDLDRRVYGIGPAKVAAIRPYLRFDPAPTP